MKFPSMLTFFCRCTRTSVSKEEGSALLTGFWGFFSILAGYFLLLPFRDEAGVSLGTHNLPKLFVASLLLTLAATPLATFFLGRHPTKQQGLRQLYRFLALCILGFFGLYLLTGAPAHVRPTTASHQQQQQVDEGGTSSARRAPTTRSLLQGKLQGRWPLAGEAQHRAQAAAASGQGGRRLQQAQQDMWESAQALQGGPPPPSPPPPPAAPAPPVPALSPPQRVVRVGFFLTVSLLNLVAVSSWWARAADVFSPQAAPRLFGMLGAGATLGQLVGSVVAAVAVRAPFLRASPSSPSLLPLLLSAAMLTLAARCAARFHAVPPAALPSLTPAPAPSPAAKSAGSPPTVPEQAVPASVDGAGSSWAILEGERRRGGARDAEGVGGASGGRTKAAGSVPGGARGGPAGGVPWREGLLSTVEGLMMVMRSWYLRQLCVFLMLNYAVSSFFYFEKSLVVATAVHNEAGRTAWFAAINSASAICILGLQLLATGPVLRVLGVPRALTVTPLAAGVLMAGVALNPTPNSVGMAEVARKVLTYSLGRPSREVLFTVVSREEKYSAKIFIDTVVQRTGDVVAAAAFQALGSVMGFGPRGVAAAAVPICCAWAGAAWVLGRRHEQLAVAVRRKLREADAAPGKL